MLRIFNDILDWLEMIGPQVRLLQEQHPKLADQLSRASVSVATNTSEGAGAVGGDKRRAYRIALREMRESVSVLQIGVRLNYIRPIDASQNDLQGKIIGTLVKLAKPAG